MNQPKPLILPFTDIRATDLPLVGGKGANLGEMTHAGFPVPPGFCLTTAAFQAFINACPQADALYDLLDTVTPDDVENARRVGEQVRQTLLAVPIPTKVEQAIREQWQRLGPEHTYAVRSSATAEDLPGASFAGQQDTYLGIYGEANLMDAVRRCWVSLFTDRAILYRSKNHFPHKSVKLSAVVQQMVMSEISGILFTANPLTGHRHTATIDASFGLGEALVSGLVTPDNYHVDKRDRTIIKRQIADNQMGIFPNKEGGGTHTQTLSEAKRKQTVLTDAQILELADLGIRAEAHYGLPQDMEWSIADNQLYLLQTRPITSLYPIDGLKSSDDSLHIYFSSGHQQMMTSAMSPLSLSNMEVIIPVGHTESKVESRYIATPGGRLYVDITLLLRNRLSRKVVFAVLSQFDALAPATIQAAMARPEFNRGQKLSFSFSALGGIIGLASRVFKAVWWQDLTGIAAEVDGIIARRVNDVKTEIASVPTGKAQIETMIDSMSSLLAVVLQWVPYFAAGELAKRLLAGLGGRWADPVDLDAVSLGLSGNVVTEMNLAVGDLADTARQSPQLLTAFNALGNDGQAWLKQARQLEDSAPFFKAWDLFIEKYGARGPSEIDIKALRWYEEPLPLLQVIATYLQKEPGSHRVQHQKLVEAREKAVVTLTAGAKRGPLGWLRQKMVRRLIYVVHYGAPLREAHKFLLVQLIRVIKEVLKETAVVLTNSHKLTKPDDIWFLTWSDLLAIWDEDGAKYIDLVSTRRNDLARFEKMSPPMVITSDGETPVVEYQIADVPDGALVGNPVSSGIIEGIVHVIHDPQTETLSPGEILVAPFTDPGWTPLFINAGGLIMEVGGNLTHGSVVAREYGIPAVAGVRQATAILKTGQKVRVDGNRGIIEVL